MKHSIGLTEVLLINQRITHNKPYIVLSFLLLDRYYWKTYDPINLSEGLFAIANVLTFAKLCFYLPISQQLGPLQITLGKMINVKIYRFSY